MHNYPSELFTIGYEGKKTFEFINTLKANDIFLIIDVRKNAFSMRPEFREKKLEQTLIENKICYLHMPKLGIDSKKRKDLDSQKKYDDLFLNYKKELSLNSNLLENIAELLKIQKIALMCFEANFTKCHRKIIGEYFLEKGFKVTHL